MLRRQGSFCAGWWLCMAKLKFVSVQHPRTWLPSSIPFIMHGSRRTAARGGSRRRTGPAAGAGSVARSGPPSRTSGRRGGSGASAAAPRGGGGLFTDKAFPPERSSLCKDWSMCVNPVKWGALVWRRATEVVGGTPQVFSGGIAPSDIEQGILGDCYFLSSLAVLAEFPDRVLRLFETKEGNAQGKYTVRWIQDGQWISVTVDDWIPCHPDTGKPAFTHSKGPELWVVLLEKAWAKVHGSYQAIEGGDAGDVLAAFTGAPYDVFKLVSSSRRSPVDLDDIWARLEHGDRRRFLMTTAVPYVPGSDLQSIAGLVEGHAYSLLTAKVSSTGVRLLQIRNPWGHGEWTGAWSDDAPQWTPALKAELGWTDADDGTFWMAFDDFVKHFSEVTVVRVRDSFGFDSIPLPPLPADSLVGVELTVPAAGEVVLEVHQPSQRSFPSTEYGFQYGGLGFEVVSLDPPAMLGQSLHVKAQSTSFDIDAAPGKYIVVIHGCVPKGRQCFLSTYSNCGARIRVIRPQGADLEKLILPALTAKAVEEGEHITFGPFVGVDLFEYSKRSLTVLAYRNAATKAFSAELGLDLSNLKLTNSKTSSYASVRLGPGGSQTFVCRVDREGEPTGIGYSHEDLAFHSV